MSQSEELKNNDEVQRKKKKKTQLQTLAFLAETRLLQLDFKNQTQNCRNLIRQIRKEEHNYPTNFHKSSNIQQNLESSQTNFQINHKKIIHIKQKRSNLSLSKAIRRRKKKIKIAEE